jgi:hypothetical protein
MSDPVDDDSRPTLKMHETYVPRGTDIWFKKEEIFTAEELQKMNKPVKEKLQPLPSIFPDNVR